MPRAAHWRRDAGAEARQVMGVNDVRPLLVEQGARDRVDPLVAIGMFERRRVAKRVVDADDIDVAGAVAANTILRLVRAGVAREHDDLVAAPPEGLSETCGVELRAARGFRREAMHEEQDAHHTPRTLSSSRPVSADLAPRYWPRGMATARARARGSAGQPGGRRGPARRASTSRGRRPTRRSRERDAPRTEWPRARRGAAVAGGRGRSRRSS